MKEWALVRKESHISPCDRAETTWRAHRLDGTVSPTIKHRNLDRHWTESVEIEDSRVDGAPEHLGVASDTPR